jgi:hypothetical protein
MDYQKINQNTAREVCSSVLKFNFTEAKKFFLKKESYCSLHLPKYFSFQNLLDKISIILDKSPLSDFWKSYPSNYENVNYTILCNKDGKYAWRPFQIIHPAIYVDLVNKITQEENWKFLVTKFREFGSNPNIKCLSLPIESLSHLSDKARTISNWVSDVEQRSIELSLEYEYVLQTDISDCYGSIYTHSVIWALHGKEDSKAKKHDNDFKKNLGNSIDTHLRNMSHGQSIGIPQGNAVSDFIAEIVLGYADLKLSDMTKEIKDFKIIRYRDDYRIFTNSSIDAELITKYITEILVDLGAMRLSSQKTMLSNNIIRDSLKPDKLYWIMQKGSMKDLQKNLLLIWELSQKFPNSGSVNKALEKFFKRIENLDQNPNKYLSLISIIVNITFGNPKTYPISSAILSKLISLIESEKDKKMVLDLIAKRFKKIPNTGHLQIWLQRITLKMTMDIEEYEELLCKKVLNPKTKIWESDWIKDSNLKKLMEEESVVDPDILEEMGVIISAEEVELFQDSYEL